MRSVDGMFPQCEYTTAATVSMDADSFIEVLEISESYIECQTKLTNHLSSGLLQLALAYRDNRSVCRIGDIRSDFEPTCFVDCLEDKLELVKSDGDDIQLLCGLPPPALRKARAHFRSALEEVVKMASQVQDISSKMAESQS